MVHFLNIFLKVILFSNQINLFCCAKYKEKSFCIRQKRNYAMLRYYIEIDHEKYVLKLMH